jgi:hypothetical protein
MDFYSGLAVGISSISAIGVYLAPLLLDKVKRCRDRRETHKRELTIHVLKPLIRRINYFLYQEIAIRQDQRFNKITPDMVNKYADRNFDFVDNETVYTSFNDLGKNNDEWFDGDLFSDLKNHYNNLSEEVKRTRGILTTDMPTYVRKRWELINELYDTLSSKINAPDDWGNMVTVVLMRLFYYKKDEWQTIYDTMKNIPGFSAAIQDVISNEGFNTKADEIAKIQKTIVDSLNELRGDINKEATSGAQLKGDCHYLGRK